MARLAVTAEIHETLQNQSFERVGGGWQEKAARYDLGMLGVRAAVAFNRPFDARKPSKASQLD
jgi:hypothetical protein